MLLSLLAVQFAKFQNKSAKVDMFTGHEQVAAGLCSHFWIHACGASRWIPCQQVRTT